MQNVRASGRYWRLAAVFRNNVLRISLCRMLKIISNAYQGDVLFSEQPEDNNWVETGTSCHIVTELFSVSSIAM